MAFSCRTCSELLHLYATAWRGNNKQMQFISGLILTLIATPALIWLAHHYGWLDHPDERKHHAGSILGHPLCFSSH